MVSIIIPVYNASKCLHRCIDSVLCQTYQDFELLLIDDGSQDSSGVICDDYAKKDNRISVIHQPNGGVSSARNEGLARATREYIIFVDADDYLHPNYIKGLMENNDADSVIGGYTTSHSNKAIEPTAGEYRTDKMQAFVDEHITRLYFTVPWGKMYRNSIIQDNGLRFDRNIRLAEDMVFNLEYLKQCHIVRTIPSTGYIYDEGIGNAEEKYHLTHAELTYVLDRCENCYEQLAQHFQCVMPKQSFRILVSCYPVSKIFTDGSDDEYYALYQKYTHVNTRQNFYNDKLCSPINKAIYAIISRTTSGKRDAAKTMMHELQRMYGDRITQMNHPSLFYRLLYKSIRLRYWWAASCMLSIYTLLRKK